MKKSVTYFGILVILILFFGNSSTYGNNLEWKFSQDSLQISNISHIYRYPGLQNIDINDKFSIPVMTVYLETESHITPSDFTVNPENQDIIGSILPEMIKYDYQITSLESDIRPPKHDQYKLSSVIYDIQKIRTEGKQCYAVSFLPVTIDNNNNIILNKVISLHKNIIINAAPDAHQLISGIGHRINIEKSPFVKKTNQVYGLPLGCEYVIITSTTLTEAFKELSEFRNSTGITADIAILDSIYTHYSGVDNAEQIRNYLKDFYQAGGVYVLLGGDDIVVPVRYVYYYNTNAPPSDPYYLMPSDLYYADLDGEWEVDGDGVWGEPNDDSPNLIPELIIGRLPLQKPSSAQQYISKLKNYLINPGNSNFDYLTKSFFFSSDQMRDYPSEGQHGVIAGELPSHIDVDTVRGVETPTGNDPAPTNPIGQTCIDIISEGFGFIHIIAHGRIDGFMVKTANYGDWPASLIITPPQGYNHGSIVDLEKNNKTSLYYSLSCNVGGFDLDTIDGENTDWSLTERLISSDSCGGVGVVANSRWGWVYSSYHLQKAFTKNLYGDAEGNPALAMYHSWVEYPYYRDLIYGQNYFGDPALRIHLSTPGVLDVDITPDGTEYNVDIYNNTKTVSDAIVTLSFDGIVLEKGVSNENGRYAFSTELNYGNEYLITVVKEGYTINQQVFIPLMVLSVEDENYIIPTEFYLEQNYPNPFNPTTIINYSLPSRSDITIDIINILGQSIRSMNILNQTPGYHTVVWDGADDRNKEVPSGIYFYRLTAGDMKQTRKMILMK
jgi:hypothetical protein